MKRHITEQWGQALLVGQYCEFPTCTRAEDIPEMQHLLESRIGEINCVQRKTGFLATDY